MKGISPGVHALTYALKGKPVITTLVSESDLPELLATSSNIVFILKADIFSIDRIAQQIKDSGKLAFVHFDLMEGIGKDKTGLMYLADHVGIDGIVTTKANIISEGKKCGLTMIQRMFVFDSVSLDNSLKMMRSAGPEAIEVLPGIVCSRIISRIREELDIPIIAGGLINYISDMEDVLKSGAIGISTSSKELWHWQDQN